ncbi:MAG: polysaccharide export protein [Kiritimatiellae bacterium]|nr:polysaccharide export protein [Kiritimatiellia bacterium]
MKQTTQGCRSVGIALAALLWAAGCHGGLGRRGDLPPLRLEGSSPFPAETAAVPSGASTNRTPAEGEPAPVTRPGETTAEMIPSAGGAAYRLRPGDSVVVILRTVQSEQFEMVVDENGDIKLPYIGAVRAAGRTAREVEDQIQKLYIDGKIYRFITVNVLVPTRSYFVRGEVRNPGRFPLMGSVRLLQAIAAAGGFTDFADISDIRLTRGDKTYRLNGREIERNPEKDIEIEAGDTIVVKRTWY